MQGLRSEDILRRQCAGLVDYTVAGKAHWSTSHGKAHIAGRLGPAHHESDGAIGCDLSIGDPMNHLIYLLKKGFFQTH